MMYILRRFLDVSKGYFNIMPDKESEADTIRVISEGASFRGATLWVLVFAIFIASLGLNVNSTAVIIGAMLISPLMGPITGMGLAVGINDFALLKRSIRNYIVSTVISVITATVYFALSPLDEVQSELLARTSPTFYDVLIALCGGAAGIVAIATKGKGNVLPGVAIATALMPPLCTAGYGLAIGNFSYFFGAFYLFFINTVFISLATFLGVRLMKFSPKAFVDTERSRFVRKSILVIVFVTMVPAAFMTYGIVSKSILTTGVSKFVRAELSYMGSRVISYDVNADSMFLDVVSVGREIPDSAIRAAERKLAAYKLSGYRLRVIQGSQSDSLVFSKHLAKMSASVNTDKEYVSQLQTEAAGLRNALGEYIRYEDLGRVVSGEVQTLFPGVERLSFALASQTPSDSSSGSKYVIALADVRPGKPLSQADRKKLHQWLSVRTRSDSLRLVTVGR